MRPRQWVGACTPRTSGAAAGMLAALVGLLAWSVSPASARVSPSAHGQAPSSLRDASHPQKRRRATRAYNLTVRYRYDHAWDFDHKFAITGTCVGEGRYLGSGRWTETFTRTYRVRVRRRGSLRLLVAEGVHFRASVTGRMMIIEKIEGPKSDPECTPRTETDEIPSECGTDKGDDGRIEISKKRSSRGILTALIGTVPRWIDIPIPCFTPVQREYQRDRKHLAFERIPLRKLVDHPRPYTFQALSSWEEDVGQHSGGWPYPTDFTQEWSLHFVPR